jgi:hypothetical protein
MVKVINIDSALCSFFIGGLSVSLPLHEWSVHLVGKTSMNYKIHHIQYMYIHYLKVWQNIDKLWNSPHSIYVFIIWKFGNLHKCHWFTRAQGHNLWPLQGHNFMIAKSNPALEINSLLQQWILRWLWIRF